MLAALNWVKQTLHHLTPARLLVATIASFLVGSEIVLCFTNLGHYDSFYDAGVYLESARMLSHGGRLYSTIFDSQPPLWLVLISGAFRIFGETFLSGQLAVAILGFLTSIMVAAIAWKMGGWSASLLAFTIVILSPLELQWSRTVSPEVPSSSLTVAAILAAMMYLRAGSRIALLVASLLAAGSILIKLIGLFPVPVLSLIVAVRHCSVSSNTSIQWRTLAQDQLIILATILITSIATCMVFGAGKVWSEAIDFHWVARSIVPSEPWPQRALILFHKMSQDRVLSGALFFGLFSVRSGQNAMVLSAWALLTTVGLLYHHPLFDHHLVFLIPPLAIAAGVGWSGFWQQFRRGLQRLSGPVRQREMMIFVSLAAGGMIATLYLVVCATRAIEQVKLVQRPTLQVEDLKAADLIDRLTPQNATILTDAQGIAFLADRNVSPELADTSFVRIATRFLNADDVIAYSERDHVQLFLSWSGRLALLPEVTLWAKRRFPYRVTLSPGRTLYSVRPIDLNGRGRRENTASRIFDVVQAKMRTN